MQPSTFASRRESSPPVSLDQRLVSLGKSDYPRRRPGGDVEVIEVELFVNWDRPTEMFVKLPGQPLAALEDDSELADTSTSYPIRNPKLGRPDSSAHLESRPAPPPRPV